MKLTKTKRNHSVVFNITPMIDIVFLLIIFFMTVSQITQVVDQPMPLPVVDSGANVGAPSTVTINVNAEGEIIVSGKTFTLNRTTQILKEKINQLDDADNLKIEIRCDKRCPSEFVNNIVEQLSSLGIQYVKFAVSSDR